MELNRRFEEIVTNKLDFKSKEALITQRDLSSMSKAESIRIRKSILDLVQGNNHLNSFICRYSYCHTRLKRDLKETRYSR